MAVVDLRKRLLQLLALACLLWAALGRACTEPAPVAAGLPRPKRVTISARAQAAGWRVVYDVPPDRLEEELRKLDAEGYEVGSYLRSNIYVVGDRFVIVVNNFAEEEEEVDGGGGQEAR